MIAYRKIIFGILGGFTISFFFLAAEIFLPHASFDGEKTITIPPSSGSRAIAGILKKEGAIRSKWSFVFYVALANQATILKPGRYTFNADDAIPAIARRLADGRSVSVDVVIPEGWTAGDIARRLSALGLLSEDEFLSFIRTPPAAFAERFDFLGSGATGQMPLEGYLFPDTYRFTMGATPDIVVGAFLYNFGAKLTPELRAAGQGRGRTLREIVVMASLIEREVVSDEDRAVVSGILWKRLDQEMPLQVDATINYILDEGSNGRQPGDGTLTLRDLTIDSPYNTYKHTGLPAGPIGNPGLSALKAAIYPKQTPYLYYLSRPDGATVFSRTLDEHNIAKARYLR